MNIYSVKTNLNKFVKLWHAHLRKRLFALYCKAVPTSRPSISNQYSSSGYEGDTMKYSCYLSSLGDPQVRWSWFCGQEQMRSHITYSTTYTYLTFRLSRKYHQKACFCIATSPSSILVYNRTSSRSIIYVYREWIF